MLSRRSLGWGHTQIYIHGLGPRSIESFDLSFDYLVLQAPGIAPGHTPNVSVEIVRN